MKDLKKEKKKQTQVYVILSLNIIELAEVSKIKHPYESLFCYSRALPSAAAIL